MIRKKRKNVKTNVTHDNMQLVYFGGYLREVGSSKSNFEQEILKSTLNGLEVGDINHSLEPCSKLMSFLSEQVTERLKSLFRSRLDHTWCNPSVNLQANKGKNVYRKRQFTSVVTVVSKSPKLLTYVYLRHLTVKSDNDYSVT